MKKYEILMFDVDDTLLDFAGCEYPALKDALGKNGIDLNEEGYEIYKLINSELWQNFEAGIYSKKEILTLRFDLLFVQIGAFGDAAQVSHDFLLAMGRHIQYEPEAKALMDALKGYGTMVIITNGARLAQRGKLESTGLGEYFDYTFISDDTGFHKPQKEYFDLVAAKVEGFDKDTALIIGDSVHSDIAGGNNYGIDTCWYNKFGYLLPDEIEPTYEITRMSEVRSILGMS